MNVTWKHWMLLGCVLTFGMTGCRATGPSFLRVPVAENDHGPRPGSEEWWEREAERPIGSRQVKRKGLAWPPYPRPTGPRQQLSHKFYASHYWPHPYNCQDQRYVEDVLALQEVNGWTDATTLYSYHFEPETHQLTSAGRLHLQWILMHAPVERRMVFLQEVFDQQVNEQRKNNVQTSIAEIGELGQGIEVTMRITTPTGRPAEEVDLIRRAELGTLPPPRVDAALGSSPAASQTTGP